MLKQKAISAVIIAFSSIIAVFLIILGISFSKKNEKTEQMRLIAYKNTVALYRGDELIQTYGDIVLNTLPENDRLRFSSGIEVANESEAQSILEDYDG